MIIYRLEGEIRLSSMPAYAAFMGHKEMALPGATSLLCQQPPPPPSLSASFITHSYLSPSPSPTLVQIPRP